MTKLSFPKEKTRIVLFEGIHQSAVDGFHQAGYNNVTLLDRSLSGDDLHAALEGVHMVGVRSRTHLTKEVLGHVDRLMAIGCFCIGTNQVDLDHAAHLGIPVFNAPHSNTRSVAELVIAEMVMLYRGLGDKNTACHQGQWQKSATGSHELRGSTLGIVGYGHIGSQVSILAEAFGLRVVYYDTIPKLAMGNAKQLDSLEELLAESDAVTLHVPAAPDTVNLMNRARIRAMRPGAILINASRGNVVDIDALAESLEDNRLLGAAVDVYPKEPKSKGEDFTSRLQGVRNAVLTPHIGGSTLEAQYNIGREVSRKLIDYSDAGATLSAVNFPQISLPAHSGSHRLLHIHHNEPGVLQAINAVLVEANANVLGQHLQTAADVGYVVVDVDKEHEPGLRDRLEKVPATIRCRILY